MNVITPKPRNAKKVSATLAMISRTPGYDETASSEGSMFQIVTAENSSRVPTTIHTITLCTRATALEPTILIHSMPTSSTAKTLAHAAHRPR